MPCAAPPALFHALPPCTPLPIAPSSTTASGVEGTDSALPPPQLAAAASAPGHAGYPDWVRPGRAVPLLPPALSPPENGSIVEPTPGIAYNRGVHDASDGVDTDTSSSLPFASASARRAARARFTGRPSSSQSPDPTAASPPLALSRWHCPQQAVVGSAGGTTVLAAALAEGGDGVACGGGSDDRWMYRRSSGMFDIDWPSPSATHSDITFATKSHDRLLRPRTPTSIIQNRGDSVSGASVAEPPRRQQARRGCHTHKG